MCWEWVDGIWNVYNFRSHRNVLLRKNEGIVVDLV